MGLGPGKEDDTPGCRIEKVLMSLGRGQAGRAWAWRKRADQLRHEAVVGHIRVARFKGLNALQRCPQGRCCRGLGRGQTVSATFTKHLHKAAARRAEPGRDQPSLRWSRMGI